MPRFVLTALALVACTKEAPSAAPASASSPGFVAASQQTASHAANALTTDAQPEPTKGAPTVTANTPLTLSVSTLTQAHFQNASEKPQYVLHSLRFQPSRLHLYSASGSDLPARDRRDTMKFDSSVRREEYQVLEPHAQLPLFTPKIQESGATFDLTWGPFSFSGLSSGEYDAMLEWESARDDYTDEAGQSHRLSGVWQGTVRSPHFKVKIP